MDLAKAAGGIIGLFVVSCVVVGITTYGLPAFLAAVLGTLGTIAVLRVLAGK